MLLLLLLNINAPSNLDTRLVTLQKELKGHELSTWTSKDDTLQKKHGPLLFFKTHEVEYPILRSVARSLFL